MKQKYLGKLDLESEDTRRRIGKGKITTHISLFTGCGGLDLGFAQADIQTMAMVEFDKSACETLRWNFHWNELKKREVDGKPKWKNREELLEQKK